MSKTSVLSALQKAVSAMEYAENSINEATAPSPAPKAPDAGPNNPLLAYLVGIAQLRRKFEETDPQSVRPLYEDLNEDLQVAVAACRMYQQGPEGSGMTAMDRAPATKYFQQCLHACTKTGIDHREIIEEFLARHQFKNWADVNVETDLVVFRSKTPGAIEVHLNPDKLKSVMDATRQTPGAIDRAANAAKDSGVNWDIMCQDSGEPSTTMRVSGIDARWAACLDVQAIKQAILDRLAVAYVDQASSLEGWWDVARADRSIPPQLVQIVRTSKESQLMLRKDVKDVAEWAAGLMEGENPIKYRKPTEEDVYED